MDKTLLALKDEIEERFPSARAKYVNASSGDYLGVSIWGLHIMLYQEDGCLEARVYTGEEHEPPLFELANPDFPDNLLAYFASLKQSPYAISRLNADG
jgi:hypothetical protein